MKLDIKAIQAEIYKIDTIPTIPDTFKKILNILENPKSSLSEIGKFILKDPVLTSRVLKMVNSPIYGFPGRITSVNQALLLLGLNVIRGLLLGVSVFEAMQKAMRGLWEHSLGNAVTARIIAQKINIKEPEEVAVAGLLHDIGKVILILKFPNEYEKVVEKINNEEIFIFDAEKEIFGINHADAGAWLAKKWNFPITLIETIEYHHRPLHSKTTPLNTAIVHLADILVRAKGVGSAGDNFVPSLKPSVWNRLNLSEKDILEIFIQMEDLLNESESLIL